MGAAGQSVTTTALAAPASALCIAVVLPRADRRRVMIGLTALAVVSGVLVALAGAAVLVTLRRQG